VVAWVLATGTVVGLLKIRWRLHLLRAGLSIMMLSAFAFALKQMPMTSAYAIFFVAPLLITALSVPMLGEHVGPRRWAAIAVGLVGVLVVLRPTGEGLFGWAGLAVVVAAAGYALSAILVRVLHRTDSGQSMVFWMLVMTAVGASLLALPGWVPLRLADAWVIAGVGVTGFLGQVAITEAFRSGEASVVAPFEYSALAWGLGLDLMIWGVLPDGWTFFGAGIIVASGLYMVHRERVLGRRRAA
jgi:drug/metabolite transporter (DMT)-like permease